MEARQFEEVVACAPSDEEIAEQKTNAMVEDVKTISKQAAVLNIQSEADYNDAAEIGKGIRARIKTVQALFKPIKEAANLAHKRACEQEKALLDPLKKAEQAVTCEMSRYTEQLEKARIAAEEAAKAEAQKKSDELLQQAAEFEQIGESDLAASALQEAQILNESSDAISVSVSTPSVKGVSKREDYEVIVEDPEKVPISILGAVIRPVDLAAVKRLVKATKGDILIPGIRVIKTKKTVLRA